MRGAPRRARVAVPPKYGRVDVNGVGLPVHGNRKAMVLRNVYLQKVTSATAPWIGCGDSCGLKFPLASAARRGGGGSIGRFGGTVRHARQQLLKLVKAIDYERV